MLSSLICVLSIFAAMSSAQLTSVAGHVPDEKMGAQSASIRGSASGRRTKTNLRSGGGANSRNLQFSMSMSLPLEGVEVPVFAPEATYNPNDGAEDTVPFLDAIAPTGCTSDEECPMGSSCKCWLSCRFCIAQFAPCGVCEEL
jgi:hypothetical protein